MKIQTIQQNKLEEFKVNIRLKLATLWTSLMFLIIYLDYFHLYMPGSLKDMLAGKVFVFDVTQVFLLAAFAMVTIPAVMIFLSVALPAEIDRWANIIIATVNIPFLLFNLAGVAWIHMVTGAVVQVILSGLIIYYAWKWPRAET